jgi:hypothetical protein
MNLVESQNILRAILKIFGFFPMNFGGKFGKIKNHLYNAVVSITIISAFTIIGYHQMDQGLVFTTEESGLFAYLNAMMEVYSIIICYAIIKIYLLLKSEVQEKYFDKLRDLEATVRSYHVKNTKMNKVIKELRKSTLRQEIFLFSFYVVTGLSFTSVASTNSVVMYAINTSLYDSYNCFFNQILIFLEVNMEFARQLQNHLNQVLLNLQKHHKPLNVEDFIKINLKIRQCLVVLNEAFGFIFLITFLETYAILIPEFYRSILTIMQLDSEISLRMFIYIILNFVWPLLSYYHLGKFAFECDKMKKEVIFYIHRFT